VESKDMLEDRRQELLRELGQIRTLRKGSLSEQWFASVQNGKKTKRMRGPYFVWSRKERNKTVSERICGEEGVARARLDEAHYKRFRELCRDYEAVAQELGALEREPEALGEAVKKGLKPRSNKVRKSRG
jgi:hypothetical protein